MAAAPLMAQDTVRVGVTYRPGVRPGVVVLPAAGLDSIHAIVARDLEYSNRLEVIPLTGPVNSSTINHEFFRNLGADLAAFGQPLLTAALESPAQVVEQISGIINELKVSMLCAGAANLSALRNAQLVRQPT